MDVDEARETQLSESAPDPFLGRTFDGYRVDEVLGRGGMGVVYKAEQLSLKRPVAIKVLPKEFTERPQFLERFHREVDILSRLSHPNIVTVFERGEVDGNQYLVMEYVQGTSLREVVKEGPLPPAEALTLVRAVLGALEHAHAQGIVHRDIKPENVLVAPGGIVKVADFGLSRLVGPAEATRLTHTHLMLGTFEYMAPEQREKAKEADERSDLYATGVVLYEMIAGELPIGHFDPLSRKRPEECDARIDRIVERSLDKEPDRRYQQAAEMGDDVSRLLSGVGAAEAPPLRGFWGERHGKKDRKLRRLKHAAEAGGKKKKDYEELNLQEWVAVAALIAGVLLAAWFEFSLSVFEWTALGMGFIGVVVFLPPLLKWLWPRLSSAAWIPATVVPLALAFAWSMYWGEDEFEFDALRVKGTLGPEFVESVLENPKVQLFVKEVAVPHIAWPDFPEGIDIKLEVDKIVIEIERDRVGDKVTASQLAAAIAAVADKNSAMASRIMTAGAAFEKELENAPLIAEDD